MSGLGFCQGVGVRASPLGSWLTVARVAVPLSYTKTAARPERPYRAPPRNFRAWIPRTKGASRCYAYVSVRSLATYRPASLAAGARPCRSLLARPAQDPARGTSREPGARAAAGSAGADGADGEGARRPLRGARGAGGGAAPAAARARPAGRWLLPWLRKAGGAQWAVCGSAGRTSHFAHGKQCDILCCALPGNKQKTSSEEGEGTGALASTRRGVACLRAAILTSWRLPFRLADRRRWNAGRSRCVSAVRQRSGVLSRTGEVSPRCPLGSSLAAASERRGPGKGVALPSAAPACRWPRAAGAAEKAGVRWARPGALLQPGQEEPLLQLARCLLAGRLRSFCRWTRPQKEAAVRLGLCERGMPFARRLFRFCKIKPSKNFTREISFVGIFAFRGWSVAGLERLRN